MGKIVFALFLVGAGWLSYTSYEHRNDPPPPPPKPYVVSVAPDGTTLWAIEQPHTTVYFSTSGTQHTESYMVGKIIEHRDVRVPNGTPK